MRPRASRERIDLAVYPQSLFLLLRNPIIILGPLLSSVITAVVQMLDASSTGVFGAATIFSLIELVLRVFGLALAVVVADMVWRRGRTSFDEAWEETRRKAGDIVFSGLGLSMLVYVAQYLGSIISGDVSLALAVLAMGTFIYAIPAASIGGIDGMNSLQASLDMTKSRPINTIILAIVTFAAVIGIGFLLPAMYFSGLGTYYIILSAAFQAIAIGYIATCLAKRYADVSFRQF